jgi:hypothetical protein
MRKDPPVGTQVPEWKKEVAEKVRAYGERKKRLTTPPRPLKENTEVTPGSTEPKPAAKVLPANPQPVIPVKQAHKDHEKEEDRTTFIPVVNKKAPALEFWTEDMEDVPSTAGVVQELEEEEPSRSNGPYFIRRFLAFVIDHIMLIVVTALVLFGFSFMMKQPMEWFLRSEWTVSLLLFLLMHFLYQLYFFRATRQTPGMLFLSLELRDPVIPVIPFNKIVVRWFAFILLNAFNLVPILFGKKFLLLDRISGTEMRSFK